MKKFLLLILGLLLNQLTFAVDPAFASMPPNSAPTFVSISPGTLTVCSNGIGINLGVLLEVNDGDIGQTLIWTVITPPTQGSLTGFPHTETSNGSNVTPSGLVYNPGGSGSDVVVVQVSDGVDNAQFTINVTINSVPTATAVPSSQTKCTGAGITPIVLSSNVGGTTFDWVRDNTATVTGIPASGSGNISGALTNTTNAPVLVTFTVTPANGGCPGAAITATVTVNPLPDATITGGGVTVCGGSTVTLSAVADPNYTYQWGKTFFSPSFTNLGTAQTQAVTGSGIYNLRVTDQAGCTDTSNSIINISDYVFNGSLAPGDAVQTGRLNRFAVISTCAAPKACPGEFTTVGSRLYDSYTITNPHNVAVCATIGHNTGCATNTFMTVYLNSYNPTSHCTNYLADPGSSPNLAIFMEVTIPAFSSIVVVIHEVNSNTGCGAYTLTVDLPREPAGITAVPGAFVCTAGPAVLTASMANTYSWTPNGELTQSINAPVTASYGVTLGYGNHSCTASSSLLITYGSPSVNPVPDHYYCSGASTDPITFSGLPGTTFNWTNNDPSIGLGVSGTGDIGSFTALNNSAAPITSTITVTPVNGSCTGAPITFTITVANEPQIPIVTDGSVCEPGGVVNLSASGSGTINWFDAAVNGNLVNTGNTYSPNISASTTYHVESVIPVGGVNTLSMPPQSNTFPGNVRGYWFTAPTDFVITSLFVPTTASSGNQSIAVLKFNGNVPPPVFSASTNAFTTLFLTQNNTASGNIPVNITIHAGEVIGFLGYRGTTNSYAPGDYQTTIFGLPVQLERLGMQFQLTTTLPRDIWREFGPSTSISRIEFNYTHLACASSPRVPVTGTIDPLPAATATPASQTKCSGETITTIALTSTVAGSTFVWTRDHAATVTGIPANGTGDIFGALTNTTNAPALVTFTIIPTSAKGCVGLSITATVLVNPKPDALAAPPSQTICSGNSITTIVLSGNVNGTTYNWTRDNTIDVTGIAANGSGDISGSLTNTTNAPVLVTFTVTPTANGCNGATATATVLVQPVPIVTAIPTSQSICSDQSITPIVLSGIGTFNWTRDHTADVIGIPANGSGDITGTLTNSTNSPITVTFTITPSSGTCNGHVITASVTVNQVPVAAITGGGVSVCGGSTVTLSAAANINYTYQWRRSLSIPPYTNLGTAQTQNVTASGFYHLIVSNQFACSDTDSTVVNIADFLFNGSIGVGDPQQTGRLNRFGVISSCSAPKACPGLFTTTGARFYDSYSITNPRNVPVCATIGLNSGCSTNIFAAVYHTMFNPASPCTNYLGDPGVGPFTSVFMEVTIPAMSSVLVVVHELNPGLGCGTYNITVDVPREPAGITVSPAATVCNNTPVTITASAANTYLWNPGGATTQSIVQSFSGTNSYTVTLGYGNNSCTATASQTVSVFPTPNAVASVPSQTICSGASISTIVLSGNVAGTTFNWVRNNSALVTGIPSNGSGNISGSLTNTTNAPVLVTFTITPTANGCPGAPITATVLVNPSSSTAITSNTGSFNFCKGSSIILSAGAGYPSYQWSTGATTQTIATSSGATFTVTVTNSFGCTASASVTTIRFLSAPATPGTISGPISGLCNSNGNVYSISPVLNATSYQWTVTNGTIVNGQGTTSITVNFGAFTNSVISVKAVNPCGKSNARTLNVISKPAAPLTIFGDKYGVCKMQGVKYSVNPVAGASGYEWTVPSGVTIVSGQGTTLLTVNFNNSFSSGSICVRATNSCGKGPYTCMNIIAKPQAPVVIIGPTNICVNQPGVVYSTPSVFGATSYIWTVPNQAVIVSGQGTPSIVVNFSHNAGKVEVWAKNACGTSSDFDLKVRFVCRDIDSEVSNDVNLFPNPVHENLKVSIDADINRKCVIRLFDIVGQELMFDTFNLIEGENLHEYPMADYPKGVYLITVEREGLHAKTIRVVVE